MQLLDLTFQNHSDCIQELLTYFQSSQQKSSGSLAFVVYYPSAFILDTSLIDLIQLPSVAKQVLSKTKLELGLHRFYLTIPSLSTPLQLTICLGPLDKTLSQLNSRFDVIVANPQNWSQFTARQLSRLCHLQTLLFFAPAPSYLSEIHTDLASVAKKNEGADFNVDANLPTPTIKHALSEFQALGFVRLRTKIHPPMPTQEVYAYRPAFQPKAIQNLTEPPPPQASILVVGAGLSGAICAYLLASKGYKVKVLEAHEKVASQASGLPAGLMVPLQSTNNPAAALTQQGLWATCQLLARLGLQDGMDYELNGVLEKKLRPSQKGMSLSKLQPNHVWHSLAGWIKPTSIVLTCLKHPLIELNCNSEVVRIQKVQIDSEPDGHRIPEQPSLNKENTGNWQLLLRNNHILNADIVILANSTQIHELLNHSCIEWNTQAFQHILGQVSFASKQIYSSPNQSQNSNWPSYPVNGWGHLLPHVPLTKQEYDLGSSDDMQYYWMAGSSYQNIGTQVNSATQQHALSPTDREQHHQENLEKIARLLGCETVQDLLEQQQCTQNPLQAWQGVRLVSQDRLPLVGALQADLYICSAMGSRGLSLATLSAQILTDQILQLNPGLGPKDSQRLQPKRFISKSI